MPFSLLRSIVSASIPATGDPNCMKNERSADRSHRLASAIPLAAVLISLTAMTISILQYKNAVAVRTDSRKSAENQRKSLEASAEAAKESLRSMRALVDQS